jgi:hypothetical protein
MWSPFANAHDRLRHPTFLRRLVLSLIGGYAAAALGGALVASLAAMEFAYRFGPEAGEPGSGLVTLVRVPFFGLMAALFLVLYLLVEMLPAALATLPFGLAAALWLRTPLLPTMAFGAVVGAMLGWPTVMLQSGAWDPWSIPVAIGAGAAFCMPLWYGCIGHERRNPLPLPR